ncbi:beta-propeller domain-containing protein [Humisphaera borealis]|uniref:PQQ-binding-like beta-propeller repeat protein n=1 Tax=Humisphaera borealis TaxID=2807512 RepID=A0A7M2WTE5_9BACT|nr:PQQ-binding-like beta-propeller repeat protein [Humisphaera borealis]QOV88787.1 PQQ-binding-like beta-propeller repeat protein [Humisphaera borealis]
MLRRHLAVAVSTLLLSAGIVQAERHIYVADHSIKKVLKITDDGKVLWEADNNNGHDVQLLKNGNVLVNCPPGVREYSPDGKIVWEAGKDVVGGAEAAQRLENGNTVIADNSKHRVVEIDQNKKIVWSYDVPNSNNRKAATMRQVRRLDNGNTLICASTLDKVLEVDKDGKTVWQYEVPFPYLATRQANGNTIISSGDGYGSPQGFFVIEVDKDGKTVWKYGGADAPKEQKLNWPSGFVRLANGNTLISEAHAGVIREVSPDKKIVKVIKSPAMKHPCTLVVVEE